MTTEAPHAAGNIADSPERIRAEIERTRQQLGDTVERLAAKTDVKRRARAEVTAFTGRAKSALMTTRRSAAGSARQTLDKGASTARRNPVPLAVAAGLVLAAVSLAVWRRARQHGKGA
jgi:Protein of unknown function (DUF3618)